MGWGDELDKNSRCTLLPLSAHALVKKPQELTDRIWNNIKQPLIKILEELKKKRLAVERFATLKKRQNLVAALLKAYAREWPVTEVIPGPADVCSMDEFRTIIEDTDVNVEVSGETFKQAMDRLPQLITEWRIAKDAELVHIINQETTANGSQSKSQSPNDRTQLELATTIFQCKVCEAPISYPRILVHSCVRSVRDSWRYHDELRARLWQALDDASWNYTGDRVGIDLKGRPAAAREIVIACGLDLDTTTAGEMDDLDVRLECLGCHSEF